MSIKIKKSTWKKIAISALYVVNSSLTMMLGSEDDKKELSNYYKIAYEQSL